MDEAPYGPERRKDSELLIRIDERVRGIQEDVGQLKDDVAALRETQVRYDPEQFVPRFSKTTREWEDYKTTRKVERRIYVVIAAAVASILTLLLSPLANALVARALDGR